jgi:hypothetical protein
MEKVGMRGRFREFEPLRIVERPPHRAEFWFSVLPCGPLPASGARCAATPGNQRHHTSVISSVLAAVLIVSAPGRAAAQEWPTHPIVLVVPFVR